MRIIGLLNETIATVNLAIASAINAWLTLKIVLDYASSEAARAAHVASLNFGLHRVIAAAIPPDQSRSRDG